MQGYWKPCRETDLKTNFENFAAEVVSFHIDHILGFYRTPAVVPRIFSHDQFEELANRAEVRIMWVLGMDQIQQFLYTCNNLKIK